MDAIYDISRLKLNQVSLEIYGADEDISDLIESIQKVGLLEPLVVKADGTVISGNRRLRALQLLASEGKIPPKIPCKVIEPWDELQERELIVEYNKQRKKTFSQLMKEAEVLEEVERERAKQRQANALNIGAQTRLPLPSRDGDGEKGRTSEKIAKTIETSPRTYERAKVIWEAAKEGNEAAKELVQKLDAGELGIRTAYEEFKRQEKIASKKAKLEEIKSSPVAATPSVVLGDCVAEMRKMQEASVSLILTDPPYGIDEEVEARRNLNPTKYHPQREELNRELTSFDEIGGDYYDFTRGWMAEAFRVLKPGGHLVVWMDRAKVTRVMEIGESLGFKFKQFLFWVKDNPVPIAGKIGFMDAVEEMLWFIKPGAEPTFNKEVGERPNYFRAPIVNPRLHPTEKPQEILKVLIMYLTNEGDLVLDPFAGSGSTLVAGLDLGRRVLGVEIDELYYKVMLKRISEHPKSQLSGPSP